MPLHSKTLWKAIKLKFEGTVGKKKPSEKLFGVFRKSSGLESAFEAVDKATAEFEKKLAELKAAHEKVVKAHAATAGKQQEFFKVVADGLKSEGQSEVYKDAVRTMQTELDKLDLDIVNWINPNNPLNRGYN